MRTGFERDIGRGSPRRLTGVGQRLGFGMRPASNRGNAAADDGTILDDHAADGRVGGGKP